MIVPRSRTAGGRQSFRATFIISVLASFAELIAQPPASRAAATEGILRVSIVDEEKRPTPVRVELLDEQGRPFIADDALPIDGDPWKATWNLDQRPNQSLAEAMALATRKVVNRYTRTEQFYADGGFQLSLPAGKYAMRVFKGLEYRVAREQFEVPSAGTTKLTVTLERWIAPREHGWYSGESHVHIARPFKELNHSISRQMQAEDLYVTNLLQWGLAKNFHNSIQYAHGPAGVYREGNYLLVAGQENPRSHFLGHGLILGAESPINFPDSYLLYHKFWEAAQRQNALPGWAHFAATRGAEAGIAIDLLDGLVAVLEVITFDHANYDIWYDALNLGFRITPIAGTDYITGNPYLPGRERFYTKVAGPLTYEAWLDGVRRGRTIVTNGAMLDFTVDGKSIGDETSLRDPGNVVVEGSVRFDPERDDIERLEFVLNGDIVRTFTGDGKTPSIECHFSQAVSENCWMALRVSGKKRLEGRSPFEPNHEYFREPSPSVAHTAPIYVRVRNTPALSAQGRAKLISQKWLGRLVDLEKRLTDDGNLQTLAGRITTADYTSVEYVRQIRSELLQRIAVAKSQFQALAQ